MILFKAEHVQPILDRIKTQTRRMGKKRWNVGAIHQCKRSYVGEPFARVRIKQVYKSALYSIHPMDVLAEGYWSRDAYIEAFARINKMTVGEARQTEPWVVDFELVSDVEVNDALERLS